MKKIILITGASRGIGREMALSFASEGYLVAANYNKSETEAKQLKDLSPNIFIYKADVSNRREVNAMVNNIHAELGLVNYLINNAAVSTIKMFSDVSESEWDNMFGINVKGTFNCTQEVLPDMIHTKSGSIINISSIWGLTGSSCEVHYSATKAALIGFTKALAKETGPSGIRVNCIAPGVIDTEINSGIDLTALTEETPLGRIGSVKDISDLAVFLTSDKASFITGQVISPNGGLVI